MTRTSQPHFDVVVIGAGAAGMMCAATAGQRGRRVLLVDHYPKLGEKIRISGGGRCNFTNLHASPANYLSRNPHFCRSALARYTPRDFIALVEKHGIAYHEKTLGQLFCDDAATQVIDDAARRSATPGGVEWRMPCEVRAIARDGGRFRIDTAAGPVAAASLVIATGGLTVPKIGATPFGYKVAEQFGLAIVPPKPALVPLSFDPAALARYGDLSGVSVDAEVSCRGARFRENLLFTHRGLSGPAILQVSSYWQDGPRGRSHPREPAAGHRRARVARGTPAREGAPRRRCWPSACRSASRRRGARSTASQDRWRSSPTRRSRKPRRGSRTGPCIPRARSATTRRR